MNYGIPYSTNRKLSTFFQDYQSPFGVKAFDKIERYFISLDGIDDFYELSSTITLNSDYSIELDVYFVGELMNLVGNTANFNNRVKIRPDGAVEWRAVNSSVTVQTSAGVVEVNKINTIKVTRTGTNGNIAVNGVTVFNGTVPGGTCLIDQIGATNTGGTYAEGIIANLVIKNDGVKIIDMPINSSLLNKGTDGGFGPELVTNITTDAGSSYIDGVLTLIQDAGNEFAQTDASLTSGVKYVLSYTIISESLLGENLNFADSSSNNFQTLPSTVGVHTVEIIPNFTSDLRFIIRNESSGMQVVMSNISIRTTTGIIPDTPNNIIVNKATTLGIDEYNGGITESVNSGTYSDNLDGTFTVTGTGGIASGVRDNDANYLIPGNTYIFSGDAVLGELNLSVYDAAYSLVETGNNSIIFTATSTTRLYISPKDSLEVTYKNISIKEIPSANPYATATNIPQESSRLFVKKSNEWIGEELITQSVWENPSAVGNEWAFVNNKWVLTGSGLANALTLIAGGEQPYNMRLVGNLDALSGGNLSVSENASVVLSTTGEYSLDMDLSSIVRQQYKRQSGVVNATLSKPSLKQLLKVS